MINNYNVTDRNPRINKYKGLLLEDDRVPKILNEMQSNIEVASLSDIKEPSTNVIYKVPTINGFNKNYIFGQEFDIISNENGQSFMEQLTQILISKGVEEDDVEPIFILSLYVIATINITLEGMCINMYDNGKYIFKNSVLPQLIEQEEPIDKSFDTIDELYDFVTEVLKIDNEQLQKYVSVLNKYNLEYKYTIEPLNDSNLFLNVVERAGDTTYKYYIWNGEKYNEIGGETGLKIIKVQPGTFIGNTHTVDLNRSITLDELELLKNNKAILALGTTATMGDTEIELYDYLFNPSVSVIGGVTRLGYFHGRSLLDQPSISNTIGTNFILSSENLNELKWYDYENNELLLAFQNFNTQINSTNRLIGLYKNTADSNEMVDLYLPLSIQLANVTYSNNQFNFNKGDFELNILDQIVNSVNITCIQVNLQVKLNGLTYSYCCVMHLRDNEGSKNEGIITIYDTSEHKVTYVEISGLSLSSSGSTLTIKAYKDGQNITTDFLTNTFKKLYIYGL